MSAEANTAAAEPQSPLWARMARALAACAACALALWAAFIVLLALALSATSDTRIAGNLRDAAESGVLSRDSYPRSPFGGVSAHQNDVYTDCVALGMNLANQDVPLLRRIAASKTAAYETSDLRPCERLVDALRAGRVEAEFSYLRFWHGYQIYTRPLLALMPLDAVRRLTAILFFGVLALFAWRLNLVFGPAGWVAALLPFFALSDFLTAPSVMTHALSLASAFLPAALVPILLERYPKAREMALPVFVFAAGAVSNFFNFLINPPLAPALIAFMYIVLSRLEDERETLKHMAYGLGLAALWYAGFAAAWVEKWIFAAAALGPEAVFDHVRGALADYETARARLEVNFLGASRRNLQHDPSFFAFVVAAAAASTGLVLWRARTAENWRLLLLKFAALLAPLAAVVLWIELARGHSAVHVGFVSRSFLLFAVFPMLAAFKLWREEPTAAPRDVKDAAPAAGLAAWFRKDSAGATRRRN